MTSLKFKDIVFTLYIILVVIDRLFSFKNEIFLVRIIQLSGMILFLLIIKHYQNNNKILIYNKPIIVSVSLLLITSLLVGFIHYSYFNFLIVFNILGFYAAALYITDSTKKIKIFNILFWLVCLLFLFYYLSGVSIMEWNNGSYNHLSVLMIFLTSMVYIENYRNDNSLNIIPAIITLIISFYATGRSGIISSSLLVLAIFFSNISSQNPFF